MLRNYDRPNERKFRREQGYAFAPGTTAVLKEEIQPLSQRVLEIDDGTKWRFTGEKNNQSQTEHDELFASIRGGKPINNGDYMSYSTLVAIMGRMATYTGQKVTWEQALNSKESLSPDGYTWGSKPPKSEIAIPGVTKLI